MADGDDIEQKIKLTYETNADKTAKKVDNLDDSIQDTTKSQQKSEKQTKKNKQSLEDLGGGIGNAIKGFKGLIKQMWLIVANPVGLIIVAIAAALTGLFKAFTSTKAGAEKFDQVMAGISATIDVVRDRVLKIASAISKFFSGDFKGALEDGRAAVSGFGDEVAAEFRKAADATRSLQEVADAMRDLSVTRARLDRDLAKSEQILTDVNATYADKKKALEEVEIAEKKQTDAELENAEKKLAAIRALNSLSDSSSESLQEEADAQIALFNLQKKSAEDIRKVAEFNKRLDNEEQARIKVLSDARKKASDERAKQLEDELKKLEDINKLKLSEETKAIRAIQDLNDKTEEEKLARRRSREEERIAELEKQGVDTRELLILNDTLFNELEDELEEKRRLEKEEKDAKEKADQLERDKKFAEDQAKIDEAVLNQKKTIEEAKIGLLGKSIGLIRSLFGKNKDLQKGALIADNALAIAKTVISTQASNATAIAEGAALAIPTGGASVAAASALVASNNISAGVSTAAIIAATAKGLQALGGGSGGGAPSSGGGGGGSAAPQVGFQASSENQIATSISENTNEQPPVQAFIVESEVTTAQALARNRIESNTFS